MCQNGILSSIQYLICKLDQFALSELENYDLPRSFTNISNNSRYYYMIIESNGQTTVAFLNRNWFHFLDRRFLIPFHVRHPYEWAVKEGSTIVRSGSTTMHEVCERYSMENCVKLHLMSVTILEMVGQWGNFVCPFNDDDYRKWRWATRRCGRLPQFKDLILKMIGKDD